MLLIPFQLFTYILIYRKISAANIIHTYIFICICLERNAKFQNGVTNLTIKLVSPHKVSISPTFALWMSATKKKTIQNRETKKSYYLLPHSKKVTKIKIGKVCKKYLCYWLAVYNIFLIQYTNEQHYIKNYAQGVTLLLIKKKIKNWQVGTL